MANEFELTVSVDWTEVNTPTVIKRIEKHMLDEEGLSKAQVNGLAAKIAAFAARVSPNLKRVRNCKYHAKIGKKTKDLETKEDFWMGTGLK